MDAAEYYLKYLAGTVNLCIHYSRTKDGKIEDRELNSLWGWVDADLAEIAVATPWLTAARP